MKTVSILKMQPKLSILGLYSIYDLDIMIFNQGYIPVASGTELNSIRTSGTKAMGVGTRWEGNYDVNINTTGKNRFVMVKQISLAAYQSGVGWTAIVGSSVGDYDGIFDGNELNITDFVINVGEVTPQGIFGAWYGSVKNMRVYGNINTNANQGTGGIVGYMPNSDAIFDNNIFTGNVTATSQLGGLVGVCHCPISNSFAIGNVTSTLTGNEDLSRAGGVVGVGNYKFSANNCHHIGNVTGQRYIGGFIGYFGTNQLSVATVEKCSVVGNTTCNSVSTSPYSGEGGFCGRNEANIGVIFSQCFVKGNLYAPGRSNAHGFGYVHNSASKITDCYMVGNVTASTTTNNGTYNASVFASQSGEIKNCYFAGVVTGFTNIKKIFKNFGGSTITNCYWDSTLDSATTSDGGTPKTTTEMKEGAINAATIYVGWSTSIWDELTNADYPQLKNNYEDD